MEFNLTDFLIGFLKLCGSLGIFLYGMKLMSEALQKVAGNKMRNILAAVTKNKFIGILTGFFITAVIQSSAATIVMVVSFVNAGLLNLVQAFSVVMGANIGTTATAWIISLLGFSVDIAEYAIPIVAFALPLLFSKKATWRYYGELILGFALLFIGLSALKGSVPAIDPTAESTNLQFLSQFKEPTYPHILLFLAIGAVLTVIVQSSSVTVAITLVMCAQGWIGLEVACAMVLGENIGSTVTANIAAMGSNLSARRAAFSHTVFNILGVCWALLAFRLLYAGVSHVVELWTPGAVENADPETNPDGYAAWQTRTAWTISLFHTVFNILNVLILSWFSKYIVMFVEKVVRPKTKDVEDDETIQLQYISTGLLSTAELSLLQARRELGYYGGKIQKMYHAIPALLDEKNNDEFTRMFDKMKKREEISDRLEQEITHYISSVSTGRLSSDSKHDTQQILRITSEIESIADACYKVACIAKHNREKSVELSDADRFKLDELFKLVGTALAQMLADVEEETISKEKVEAAKALEMEINALRTELLNQSTEAVSEGKEVYSDGAYFRDLVRILERIGDYVVNAVEAKIDHKIFKDE